MSKRVFPYAGIPSFMNAPVRRELEGDEDIVVVGVPFDCGSSWRPGSRFGPQGIRRASMIYKFYDPAVGLLDINRERVILRGVKIVDLGDIEVPFGDVTTAHQSIYSYVNKIVEAPSLKVFLGGDHSITYPTVKAYSENFKDLAVVQFDAHLDLLERYGPVSESHGSGFRRIIEDTAVNASNIIQVGARGFVNAYETYVYAREKGETIISMTEVQRLGPSRLAERIVKKFSGTPVYVSVDSDALSAFEAPGSCLPEPGGFTYGQLSEVLCRLFETLDVKAMDLVEVTPMLDVNDSTSHIAASLIIEALGGKFHTHYSSNTSP